MQEVGLIGLGTMGRPMARNLLRAGYSVHVYDINPEPVAQLAKEGAVAADTIAQLMDQVSAVVTILPADAEVKEVYLGDGGICSNLRAGQIAIEMTTCQPQTVLDLQERFRGKGAYLVDAPVSGGKKGAEAGTLSIMIGCEREIFPQVEPLLSVLGNNLFLAGDVGAGKTIKLINQMLVATHIAVLSQALALAAKTGIEPQKMYEIIRESSGHSRVMDLKMESFIVPQDFTPSFALKLMHKDLRLALDMAQATGVDSSVAQGAMQLFEEAMAKGLSQLDMSVIAREEMAKQPE